MVIKNKVKVTCFAASEFTVWATVVEGTTSYSTQDFNCLKSFGEYSKCSGLDSLSLLFSSVLASLRPHHHPHHHSTLFLHLSVFSSAAEVPPAEPLRVMWRHVAEVAEDVLKCFVVSCTDRVSRWWTGRRFNLTQPQNPLRRLMHQISSYAPAAPKAPSESLISSFILAIRSLQRDNCSTWQNCTLFEFLPKRNGF